MWSGGRGRVKRSWLKMLDKIPDDHPPIFSLLPDVVGDWPVTLERAHRYLPELRDRGIVAAVALQDGCGFEEALIPCVDWVFVGGSTAWKLANIRGACAFFQPLGIRVHVGRVNGRTRILHCRAAGADSCDGTGWGRFSNAELPKLFRAQDQRLFSF